MQQHNAGHLKALLTMTGPLAVFCIYMIYWYLLQIEINKTIFLPSGLESVGSHEDFAKKKTSNTTEKTAVGGLEEEQDPNSSSQNKSTSSSSDKEQSIIETLEGERPRRFRVTKLRHILLAFTALALSLLTYLLLVVSNASLWLSLLGVAVVVAVGLFQPICEEVRRRRLDRVAAIITLLFMTAAFLSLSAYANRSLQEGDIYNGKARIVGFDYDNYSNKQNDGITRTDLEVAWGGEWGCPTEGGKQCQAFVQGAMCESEDANNNNNRMLRTLGDQNKGNGDGGDDKNSDNGGGDNADEQDLAEEVQDEEEDLQSEEQSYEELQQENEELQEENQELQDELSEYEDATEELEEEVVDEEETAEYTHYYDDDLVADSYWDEQDWDSIWGEYACYDLFDYDLSGSTYDADEAPGNDDWPFVNIYGNCKKCEAYIVDYFSTEHFQDMQSYRTQGRNYFIFSMFCAVLTMLLHFKHRMDPIAEKELELLSNDGGAMA